MASLSITLKAESGYESKEKHRINADQWGRICKALNEPSSPRVEAAHNWISVKDRLPFRGDYVIIQGGCGYLSREDVWFTLMEGSPHRPIQWEVTHWMPLPDPPEPAP